MRYLITGAQGFIGRHLTARILAAEADSQVVGIGRSAPRQPASERYRYRRVPLVETRALRQLIREHRFGRVRWDDALASIARTAGRDLQPFYARWFDTTEVPPGQTILQWTPELHAMADALAEVTRAESLLNRGQAKDAAELLRKIAREAPSPDPFAVAFRAHDDLAQLAFDDGDLAAARAEIDAALRAPNPPPRELPPAHLLRGRIALAQGDKAAATESLHAAIAADDRLGNRIGAAIQARALLDR